jgi:hypothetical protein
MLCSPRLLRGSFLYALLLASACADSSDGGGGPVGVNNPVQAYVVDKSALTFAGVAQLRLLVPVLLMPSMYAAAGITFELDTSPAAAPHTYDFVIPFDSNGDGTKDTTLTGKAVLTSDPLVGGQFMPGFEAAVDVTLETNGGQGVFEGELELFFDSSGGFQAWGTGTYADAATASSVSLAVEQAQPLHVRTASDEPDQVANACIWSVDGTASVDASSSDGNYSADWTFSPTSQLIQVLNAFFAPAGGVQMPLPNSQFEMGPCPGEGVLADWEGGFTFDWFCIPPESGTSQLTITVLDSSTIEIVDEDPPGSGEILVYQAKRDAHDAHVVHGTFEDGSGGGTYEESFTWILAPDGQSFQQVSEYFMLTGPYAGMGGDCGGVGVRD